jgi:hypothetical protein
MTMNRPAKWIAAYALALAVLALATYAWSHELLPVGWLCVLFGPMILITLGWDASSYTPFLLWGIILMVVSLLLILPLAWRTSPGRLTLAALGIGIWSWASSIAMSIMSA